ncbi:MAG: DUF1080 domain-containing protein [Phycisphaerae bacterium]|nr:DUF1080 domain-containing protein [Phycisphaerae bacterium]
MSVVKWMSRLRLVVFVFLCGLIFAPVTSLQGADQAAVDPHLAAIRQYQCGQSRQALFAVEEAIRTSQEQPQLRKYIAGRLAGMLAEDITSDARLFICRQLWYLSADDSAAVLARMLDDEATADMACYAIGSDRSPQADAMLHAALAHLNGAALLRVVNLIGERGDGASVGALVGLTKANDTGVVEAAVAALGKIGGSDAARTLDILRDKGPVQLRPPVTDALLQCADFAMQGDLTQAARIYRKVCNDHDPLLRRAALHGLSRVAAEEAVPLVIAALRDEDRMVQRTAIGCIRAIDGEGPATVFARELPKLDSDGQVALLAALADKRAPAVLAIIRSAVKFPDAQVRTAAFAAIAKAGDASCVDLLIDSLGHAESSAAAASALHTIQGAGVEAAIVNRMKGAPANLKIQLIEALYARDARDAAEALLAEAAGPDREVRKTALSALGRLASSKELPALLEQLVKLPDDYGRREAERSVTAVSQKIANPERRADAVVSALAKTIDTAARCSLLRVLGQIGNDTALTAVTGLLEDDNPPVRDAAVRALTEQSSSRALDALAKVFSKPANETHRIVALRGYVRLLQRDMDLIDREKANAYSRAMSAAVGADEKRLIIGGLSTVRHAAALDLVRRHVHDEEVQAEAALAITKIQESLGRAPEGFTAIFDGKTLAGWEGNLNVFRIEEGAIVGGTLKAAIARNEFLCTQNEYGDFELRLKVRLLGDPAGANAGIQVRSRRVPNHHEMSGYQADMGQHYWGCLYDESRRNRVLAAADRAQLDKVLLLDRWNDYIIRCEGKRIRLWINDYQTVDYTEPEDNIEQTGLIGLQIHGGPPAEAWYKDIYLRPIR